MLRIYKGRTFEIALKFRSDTHGLFEESSSHSNRDGSQECPNCGACKESDEHVFFVCIVRSPQTILSLHEANSSSGSVRSFFVVAFLVKLYFIYNKNKVC